VQRVLSLRLLTCHAYALFAYPRATHTLSLLTHSTYRARARMYLPMLSYLGILHFSAASSPFFSFVLYNAHHRLLLASFFLLSLLLLVTCSSSLFFLCFPLLAILSICRLFCLQHPLACPSLRLNACRLHPLFFCTALPLPQPTSHYFSLLPLMTHRLQSIYLQTVPCFVLNILLPCLHYFPFQFIESCRSAAVCVSLFPCAHAYLS
jgi:hypothetical protein